MEDGGGKEGDGLFVVFEGSDEGIFFWFATWVLKWRKRLRGGPQPINGCSFCFWDRSSRFGCLESIQFYFGDMIYG